jgi:hypothetical protein
MNRNQLEPKVVLDALLKSGPPPEGIEGQQFEHARALTQSLSTASPAEVEQLAEPLSLAILEASVRARDPRLPEALVSSPRRALAKAAKKVLYQLRSLGVSVPEKKPEQNAVVSQSAAPEVLPALLSPITGSGEQALMIPRPHRGGGFHLVEALISDERGIWKLGEFEASRSAYRKSVKQFRGGSASAIELTPAEVKDILSIAAATNLSSKTAYPEGTDALLRQFEASPVEEPPLPAPEPEDERLATEAAELHKQPEIQTWLPPEDEIRVLFAKMEEVVHSPLELTKVQRTEQLSEQPKIAARKFFTPERRSRYARRLWKMADFFERTARPKPAQLARAEARRLFHSASGEPSSFGYFLFEKVLLLAQRSQAGEPLPEPGQQLKVPEAKTPPAERRSPGGLILP